MAKLHRATEFFGDTKNGNMGTESLISDIDYLRFSLWLQIKFFHTGEHLNRKVISVILYTLDVRLYEST